MDVLAELPLDKAAVLCAAFPAPDYYVAESAVREAITKRGQFNILHPPSGLKVDVIVPPDSDFGRLARLRRLSRRGEECL